ncbi:hypothetical protein [Nocardioides kribbensis]|uniref:Uncharacterized protein n=1 Tax=Nocardioides kribbensis TaxID=305517 RepID=A0ABV1NYW6_9ACTN
MSKHSLPFYHDDDLETLSDLRRRIAIAERHHEVAQEAESQANLRIGDDLPTTATSAAVEEARDAYKAFVDEAAERAEVWTVQTIGHRDFRNLLRDHPPRKVKGDDGKEVMEEEDTAWGVNVETLPYALLLFSDPEDPEVRTVVAPEFESEAALRRRLNRMSEGEFASLWVLAFEANRGVIADPKRGTFYLAAKSSDAT